MNEKNFTIIEDWMLNLGLSSNELIIFATIYSFSKGDDGIFSGRLEYFVERFHIARRTVTRIMRSLEQKGLVTKGKGILTGLYARCNSYSVNNDIISQYLCQNGLTYEPNCPNTSGQNDLTCEPNCPNTSGQNVLTYEPNCPNTLGQNVQSIYNKEYNKDYSKEYNKLYNTLSPNGDSKSDIDESELSINDVNSDSDVNNAEKAEDEKGTGTGNADKADKAKKPKAKSKKEETAQINARFEKFWAAYPRHIDKAKALKAFTKINPSDELLEQMLKSINEAKKTRQWQTQQYIPYPTTWLNGSRWEDEIDSDNTDYEITGTDRFDNPYDRAVANGENPFASDDWPW